MWEAIYEGKEPHERLRLIRQALGYTQQEVANALQMERSLLSRMETGERPITPDVANLLATQMQIDPETLLRKEKQDEE